MSVVVMSDQRFFDLAMKAIARQATDAERAELDALLAQQPELRAEFERLKGEVRLAKDVLPLVAAVDSTKGELPAYARRRLQAKVRETLGRPAEAVRKEDLHWQRAPLYSLTRLIEWNSEKRPRWRWQWWLGLATVTALALVLAYPFFQPKAPVVQIAMLDLTGMTRGRGTNEVKVIREVWKSAHLDTFSSTRDLEGWQRLWPSKARRPVVKVIYNRSAGEVRVLGRKDRKPFEKTFLVGKDLGTTLAEAAKYVSEQTAR